jgi:hypothetical protein
LLWLFVFPVFGRKSAAKGWTKALKLRGFLGGAPHSEATEAITFYLSAQNGKVVVLTGHANRETYGGD